MDDVDRVIRIAQRYGVKVYLTDRKSMRPALFHDRGLKEVEVPRGASSGPRAHWCFPEERAVYFDHLDPNEVETHLHEVCHVIMNPPGGIDSLNEDVVLMPFERVLARQCLSPRGYDKVIDWQHQTQIEWWDQKRDMFYETLAAVPRHTTHRLWRESFHNLRRMGVIEGGRVTWKWPDWRRATKALMSRGNLIGGY